MRCFHTCPVKKANGKGYYDVPCGKCIACLQNKRAEWTFRLYQELKVSKSARFITLTYDDDNIPEDGKINYDDVNLFLKRLRHFMKEDDLDYRLRYYMVGEYGTRTQRPHYHGIMFNIPEKTNQKIDKIWKKGHTMSGTVTPASIHYVTGYTIKSPKNFHLKTRAWMSRKPGIGYRYLEKTKKYHSDGQVFHVTKDDGIKQGIPRYFRDKIFDKYERDQYNLKNVKEKVKYETERFNNLLKSAGNRDDFMQQIEEKMKQQSIKKEKL